MLQTTQNTIIFPNVPVDKGISLANLGVINYADRKNPRNKSDVYTSYNSKWFNLLYNLCSPIPPPIKIGGFLGGVL